MQRRSGGHLGVTFALVVTLFTLAAPLNAQTPSSALRRPPGAVMIAVSTVGRQIQLSRLPLPTSSGRAASEWKWVSSDPTVLEVAQNGVARALRTGVVVLVPYHGTTPPTIPPYTAYQCDSKTNQCHCQGAWDCYRMQYDGVCKGEVAVWGETSGICDWRPK